MKLDRFYVKQDRIFFFIEPYHITYCIFCRYLKIKYFWDFLKFRFNFFAIKYNLTQPHGQFGHKNDFIF